MKSFFSVVFFTLFLLNTAEARVIVYEYGLEGSGENHGILVAQIACRNLEAECAAFYSEHLSQEDLLEIDSSLNAGDVINMSFAFQMPEPPAAGPFYTRFYNSEERQDDPQEAYEENLEKFYEDHKLFENVMNENPESLFVAAAGNGYLMMGMSTKGVPLDNYEVFPAFMNFENLIKVSAVDDTAFDVSRRTDYRIMDYANYSINLVDVAAPVELSDEGESLRGTSFAAPFVSRVSKQLIELYNFNPGEVKSILLRSAFIENLDETLNLSRDYVENQSESLIHKIQTERKRKDREEMRAQIPDVMLVKSGGVLASSVAFKCAESYAQARGVMTISEACLMAHESELSADERRQQKLSELWGLRNIL